ncbi:Matrixin [Quadrisphaera granulorum]|uniref:Matrixin n=1 Tax=Quadrisphaera granulorum TaxID=317664 RepID=A0A315ZQW1_9ACTN|nr:matrixin family metalloprotease [Quadrisphaera granulorum]PWJ47493.1 matrixin [Quadrisphaera granulorum]SZE98794.1 Matrixin [Quadrisphaera granulorum]
MSRSRGRTVAVAVVLSSVVAAALGLSSCTPTPADLSDDVPSATAEATADATARADASGSPQETSPAPTAPTPAAAAKDGGFAVLDTDEVTGEPIRYSPCRPIRYVTHLAGAPAVVDGLVADAVGQIARATGLDFVDEGTTDERPSPDREATVTQDGDDRYGDDVWAPVLIAWTDDRTIPDLDGDTVGLAGSQAFTDNEGHSAYVSGDLMLDGPDLTDILEEPNGDAQVRAVIAHELGHLVGLDHVDDPTQLMFAESNPDVVEPAAGDLAGLKLMGAGPCVESLATP